MQIENHPEFMKACKKVAADWRDLARGIRKENAYAAHVSESTKAQNMQAMLDSADKIEAGEVTSFTIWQRVNYKLTGECVALLPPAKEA